VGSALTTVAFPMNLSLPALAAMLALGGAILAAQLVTVERVHLVSPLPNGDIGAPAPIEMLLTRACYDCHSDRTRWPWYSRVAPASWIVARDVTLGRKELNFSEWRSYYPQTRRRKLQWMGRVVRDRAMPPWSYRLMHPGARLTEAERAMLDRWIESALSMSVPSRTTD
jgi:Haem-binding domain